MTGTCCGTTGGSLGGGEGGVARLFQGRQDRSLNLITEPKSFNSLWDFINSSISTTSKFCRRPVAGEAGGKSATCCNPSLILEAMKDIEFPIEIYYLLLRLSLL